MAPPSSLPSAAHVARRCASAYEYHTGNSLDPPLHDDLEAISRHFHAIDRFPFFVGKLVDWDDFGTHPNKGHKALADLLASRLLKAAATTNFDWLTESAASELSEPDFRAIVDIADLPQETPHRPFLKLHGCGRRSRLRTVWCREQLVETDIAERTARFRDWLAGQVVGRDLLFVGFWTDWAYMTELLLGSLTDELPLHVYVVDPSSPTELAEKAPGLWDWAHRSGSPFITSGNPGPTSWMI